MASPAAVDGGTAADSIGPAAPALSSTPTTTAPWVLPSSPRRVVFAFPHRADVSVTVESRSGLAWPAEVTTHAEAGAVKAELTLLQPLPSGDKLRLVLQTPDGKWTVPLSVLQGHDERVPWKRQPPKRRRRGRRRR